MMARAEQAGFSLTETLVALTILASVTVALAPAIRSAFSTHRALGEASEAAAVHLHLEHVLRDLLIAAVQLPEGGSTPLFEGTADAVRFAARPPHSDTVLSVTLEVSGSADAQSITVTLTSLDGGPGVSETLGDAYSDLRFLFYGVAGPGEPVRWYRDWEAGHPPRLIVLDMARRASDDALQRIELAVGGQASFQCDYDSGLQACREGI